MTAKAWCPTASSPSGYIQRVVFGQMFTPCWGGWLIQSCLLTPHPLNTLSSPLKACRTIIQHSSKFLSAAARWRAHQQFLRTCWWSSADRKAVIVERFCGLRLASLHFFHFIIAKGSFINSYYFTGKICQSGQFGGFKKWQEGWTDMSLFHHPYVYERIWI